MQQPPQAAYSHHLFAEDTNKQLPQILNLLKKILTPSTSLILHIYKIYSTKEILKLYLNLKKVDRNQFAIYGSTIY